MPQQINLCTPILLTQKRYFSAQTMVQALAILAVVGGALVSYWVWSLNASSEGFKKTLATQSRELENLQAAIAQSKAGAGPVESALPQKLQTRRVELLQREKILEAVQRGLFRPGWGHSARLQLLAQSIPPQVWLTEVRADENQLEVSGFTLETAVLSTWVNKLAASPLTKGQQLSTIKVDSAGASVSPLLAASSTVLNSQRTMWSFNLLSTVTQSAAEAGSKP